MKDLITDCLQIVPAHYADYKLLAQYHYKHEKPAPPDQIYKIVGSPECKETFPDPVAVIVYSMPIANLRGRSVATKNYFRKARTEIGNLRNVNKKIRYISRVIVDPRFHKLGLASWLLNDTLERQVVPLVETLTPIDFTNKMFQKAGFKLFMTPAPEWYNRFITALSSVRIRYNDLNCAPAVHFRIQNLPAHQKPFIEKEISLFIGHFQHRKKLKNSPERTSFFCGKIPYPQAYLLWHNPRLPSYDSGNDSAQ